MWMGVVLALVSLALAPRKASAATREKLANLIAMRPGINEVRLRKETGLQRSSVRHHLRALMGAGIIKCQPVKRENHYFPAGVSQEDLTLQSAVAHGRASEILREVL